MGHQESKTAADPSGEKKRDGADGADDDEEAAVRA